MEKKNTGFEEIEKMLQEVGNKIETLIQKGTKATGEASEEIEKKMTPEEELLAITEGILSAKNLQDLKSWRHLVYAKKNAEQQALYETRLRQLNTISK